MDSKLKRFIQSLGPGILFASTAIGVSHLVQSTRAGASFGFGLLWLVLLANLLKWPFFEFGSRYAVATGESLIDGYRKTGRWMLWIYLIITVISMFFVGAAVGAVTAGFMDNLFQISATWGAGSLIYTTGALFGTCIVILGFGKYSALDKIIKVVGFVLLISTLAAVAITAFKGPATQALPFFSPEVFDLNSSSFAFVIALMGWMPTAVDLSTWNSLWTLERAKQLKQKPSLKETLREFNLGYGISALLAPCFMLLGAYILFGTGQKMPQGSAGFASSVIDLYTQSIGAWSRPIITAAAFSIMFGTCLGVFDGYSRSMERVFLLLRPNQKQTKGLGFTSNSVVYLLMLLAVGLGAFLIIFQFGNSLKKLVDIATTLSFVMAPLIAAINLKLVTAKSFPAKARPSKALLILSYTGLVFLTAFALIYLIWA